MVTNNSYDFWGFPYFYTKGKNANKYIYTRVYVCVYYVDINLRIKNYLSQNRRILFLGKFASKMDRDLHLQVRSVICRVCAIFFAESQSDAGLRG